MTNIRPVQIHAPNWPWRNKVVNGLPYVVERVEHPWYPDLVSCFDWSQYETQDIGWDMPGVCTRDMKSVHTTAVRMYGYERLWDELESGHNVFLPIAEIFRQWLRQLKLNTNFDVLLIGDDIAHKRNTFLPPRHLDMLAEAYQLLVSECYYCTTIFHTDGFVQSSLEPFANMFDFFIVQKSLNPALKGDCFLDNDDPAIDWQSYPVKESA